VNLLAASTKPLGLGVRGQIKLPIGDEDSGASSGAFDYQFDGIVSTATHGADVAGYVGFLVRGNPEGFDLTNGLRWGIGAGFPGTSSIGLKGTLELFGEKYFDSTILAPAGFMAEDGSFAPLESVIKDPVVLAVGLTWQHSNGFFIGGGAAYNFNMEERTGPRAWPGLLHRYQWRPWRFPGPRGLPPGNEEPRVCSHRPPPARTDAAPATSSSANASAGQSPAWSCAPTAIRAAWKSAARRSCQPMRRTRTATR
jgi:hypothetical protein